MDQNQFALAGQLAERYEHFPTLVHLCEKLDSMEQLQDYFKRFSGRVGEKCAILVLVVANTFSPSSVSFLEITKMNETVLCLNCRPDICSEIYSHVIGIM